MVHCTTHRRSTLPQANRKIVFVTNLVQVVHVAQVVDVLLNVDLEFVGQPRGGLVDQGVNLRLCEGDPGTIAAIREQIRSKEHNN